ncbi:MAG TPA: hypothetical protein VLM40_05985 [Gemmata sp.]|nr:hypothetical protein [Gemmata sp.]
MRPCTSRKFAGASLLAILLVAGCAKSGPNVQFAEVEGKVTMGGKPLAGVVVTFYPVAEGTESLPYTSGTTDPEGRYKLSGLDGRTGAVVGKHRVVVNWPPRERDDNIDTASRKSPGQPIPVRYTVAGQTPFLFDVKGDGPSIIDLKVDSR